MDHPNVLRHEALTNRVFLGSVKVLIVKLKAFNRELIGPVKLLRRSLLKQDVYQPSITPFCMVLFEMLQGIFTSLISHFVCEQDQ